MIAKSSLFDHRTLTVNNGTQSERCMTESNAVKINWLNSIFLFATPVFALIGIVLHWIYFGPPGLLELIVFVGLYFACGLSITVGYHRLFSHRSHNAKWPLYYSTQYLAQGLFKTPLSNGVLTTEGITR